MDIPSALQDIYNRLQALERQNVTAKQSQNSDGPHDGAVWDYSLPHLTTLCALPLRYGVLPPLGHLKQTASNTLKHVRATQADAPWRSQSESTDAQTPRLLTREEEKRITDDTMQTWRSQQRPSIQATTSSQEHAWEKSAWTDKGKGAQSTSYNKSM